MPAEGILRIRQNVGAARGKRIVRGALPFVFLFLLILLFGTATAGGFFGRSVIIGIIDQGLIFATLSTAVALIYTAGNLDISIGNAMAVAGVLAVMIYEVTSSVTVMVLSCFIIAIGLMLFNCTLSTYLRIKPATVGIVMMQVYELIQSSLIGNRVTIKVDYAVCRLLEDGIFRYAAFVGYIVLVFVIYNLTYIGRASRFYGGNRRCAEQTGMNEVKLKYIAFAICGLGVGLAGVLTIIRAGGVSTSTGSGFGMDCMLSTVLGGMSIFGGANSKSYAGIVGALTVSTLDKGMLMVGVPTTVIQGIRGVIFLVLVYLCSERLSTLPSRDQF